MASERDRNVLNAILNPLMPTTNFSTENDDALQLGEEQHVDLIKDLDNYDKCQALEVEGVRAAEADNYEEALAKFGEAIQCCPANPSPYNNRAQVHRLRQNIEAAKQDLNKAIELCDGGPNRLERRRQHIGSKAYVQRALIRHFEGDKDGARVDYEKAAGMGSTFAKTQLIAMNPYAAMCNKMLKEVMTKVQRGEEEDAESSAAAATN